MYINLKNAFAAFLNIFKQNILLNRDGRICTCMRCGDGYKKIEYHWFGTILNCMSVIKYQLLICSSNKVITVVMYYFIHMYIYVSL